MAYAPSDGTGTSARPLVTTKILIAGGFGVGKTTMVGSISEIRPLHTEEPLTDRGVGVDDVSGVGAKTTTTVAMDFGRITLSEQLLLYLFGTPGQERFWFMWDELAAGAIGAVVLADTRRLTGSFAAIDYFERRGVPFVVAVNCFDGRRTHRPEDVAIALDLDPDVPVLLCDVRRRESSKEVLVALMEHVLTWPDSPDAPDGPRPPDRREAAT
ncbi:GTP-binding protein [Actinomadura livida]|uniref:ATP/GTP-binding protein n=1 Tax=Actinomadura livida TaxID=79909 RepID=A0A7W7IHJ7_9ACTN|nr:MULTISPECIES: ATP/GTP-binding protein [Actinomadura]MBB4777119.1 signal recognition particle receptor subunit beta [Actinomadura catellatispora]GGU21570.1 ATP-binding protein [Actinomadura livida]